MFAHFIDEESGAQRSTGEVATELTYGVCDVSRNPVTPPFLDNGWWNRTPHSLCRIQWLSLPRTGHRKLPQTDLTLTGASPVTTTSGELAPFKPSAQPCSFKKKLWPGAMPVFQIAFFPTRTHSANQTKYASAWRLPKHCWFISPGMFFLKTEMKALFTQFCWGPWVAESPSSVLLPKIPYRN